jgi:hypothetical protein
MTFFAKSHDRVNSIHPNTHPSSRDAAAVRLSTPPFVGQELVETGHLFAPADRVGVRRLSANRSRPAVCRKGLSAGARQAAGELREPHDGRRRRRAAWEVVGDKAIRRRPTPRASVPGDGAGGNRSSGGRCRQRWSFGGEPGGATRTRATTADSGVTIRRMASALAGASSCVRRGKRTAPAQGLSAGSGPGIRRPARTPHNASGTCRSS